MRTALYTRPTLAGLLTFSKYPQQLLPQLVITFIQFYGTTETEETPRGERFLDNRKFEGPISEMHKGDTQPCPFVVPTRGTPSYVLSNPISLDVLVPRRRCRARCWTTSIAKKHLKKAGCYSIATVVSKLGVPWAKAGCPLGHLDCPGQTPQRKTTSHGVRPC
ncbi:MAG: hypothetical protein EA424_21950 [Planctomycetaceae bacterium]|nr:MAG: hypothetical protein EA424_21950 [Planctomycetaceae bacterium]